MWDIKLTIKDYLCDGNTGYDSIIVSGSITKGKPTFWWDDDVHVEGDLYLQGNKLLNLVYPVGAIYMSVNNTNPGILFGGTWEAITDRFLLAAGTNQAGTTGGEATHTLTVNEMPSHTHNFRNTQYDPVSVLEPGGTNNWYGIPLGQYSANEFGLTYVGGSQPHNNMPPYLVVYMWKRTA